MEYYCPHSSLPTQLGSSAIHPPALLASTCSCAISCAVDRQRRAGAVSTVCTWGSSRVTWTCCTSHDVTRSSSRVTQTYHMAFSPQRCTAVQSQVIQDPGVQTQGVSNSTGDTGCSNKLLHSACPHLHLQKELCNLACLHIAQPTERLVPVAQQQAPAVCRGAHTTCRVDHASIKLCMSCCWFGALN